MGEGCRSLLPIFHIFVDKNIGAPISFLKTYE
jgi:hypothetical protein